MALLTAGSASKALAPPTMLSRPTIAASIATPDASSATRETTPLWGKNTRLMGAPPSLRMSPRRNSMSFKCGCTSANSEAEDDAEKKIGMIRRMRAPLPLRRERGLVSQPLTPEKSCLPVMLRSIASRLHGSQHMQTKTSAQTPDYGLSYVGYRADRPLRDALMRDAWS